VNFPVNKSELIYDFEDNANRLDRIIDITHQIMNDTTSSVKCIQIIGLASVEGNEDLNRRLAGNRAEALKRYVQSKISVPDNMFELANGGAAWTEFRDQVNDAQFEGKEQVLKLIDETPDLNRRQQLLRNSKAYNYIRQYLFPDERNAGYVRIYWDYVTDNNAKVINQASELLRQEQWQQALDLLQTVRKDERAQNALAVALYMTGSQDEALRIWRRAAAMGNEDAQRNLSQIEM
jgi:tetratricopeptide (TPR) repeat protein